MKTTDPKWKLDLNDQEPGDKAGEELRSSKQLVAVEPSKLSDPFEKNHSTQTIDPKWQLDLNDQEPEETVGKEFEPLVVAVKPSSDNTVLTKDNVTAAAHLDDSQTGLSRNVKDSPYKPSFPASEDPEYVGKSESEMEATVAANMTSTISNQLDTLVDPHSNEYGSPAHRFTVAANIYEPDTILKKPKKEGKTNKSKNKKEKEKKRTALPSIVLAMNKDKATAQLQSKKNLPSVSPVSSLEHVNQSLESPNAEFSKDYHEKYSKIVP
mmetsp:Transcript_53588/g.64631  ORF Transcript_53588/g.64631 Transcript_53588/m.64631 type:complete len:267 (-) Transcript_53588:84-884(-)|eukprot:CAMPEP_0172491466 /NCGR_PEP_ID=MMETSP1066-20121228/22309_1 /TAXON_ID=671091 /ORGANISM="Coscinodiscus wailesii, Strain CCMP2513" /LENGTH=266 /DNA_ID=CAMNT_0013260529 /DNA_START=413 /DNA_END=1213 /DNA_ORIENTATION=-